MTLNSLLKTFFWCGLLASGLWAQKKDMVPKDTVNTIVPQNNPEPVPKSVPAAAIAEESQDSLTDYGFLSFTIVPGFVRIRLDRETTIGFSENILVTAGHHWVEITSPKGYADSSFKVQVKAGETLEQVVRLRNLVSGEIASMPLETGKKEKGSGGLGVVGYTQIGLFLVGTLAGVGAYVFEQQAADAKEAYNNYAGEDESQYNTLYADLTQKVKLRNGMILLSGVSLTATLILFAF